MDDNNNYQGMSPNQQYGGPQYDPNQQYGGQYDPNQQYSQQQYDANQQYGGPQYDAGQQYGQQQYDANQQYGQQQYDAGQQYGQQQYDANQQYGQQYDANQQYGQQQYDASQQYSGPQYDASQQYGQQQYDASQQYGRQQYDADQQYSQQQYDTSQQYSSQQAEQPQQSSVPQNSTTQIGGMQYSDSQSSSSQDSGMKYEGPQYTQPQNYGQPAFSTPTPTPPSPPITPSGSGDTAGGGSKKPVNKGLIIGLIAGAAVIIAAVLLIFVFDVFGMKGGNPEETAEKFCKAYAELDAQALIDTMVPEAKQYIEEMGLGGSVEEIQSSFDMLKGFGVTFTDTKVGTAEKIDIETAKAYMKDGFGVDVEAKDAAKVKCSMNMHMELMGESTDQAMEFELTLVKQGSKWYVAGFEEVGSEQSTDGDGYDNTEDATEDYGQNTEENTEDATEETTEDTTEAAGNTESDTSTAPPAFTGEGVDATLWSWGYDQNVWSYKEDKFTDKEKQSSLTLRIPKDEDPDKDRVYITVNARITDTYEFREDLYKFGIDEHDYVEGKVPTVKVGGVDFIKKEDGSSIDYIARLEGANEFIEIKVRGEVGDAAVQPALDGLAFKVTDIGNTDGPWYWEGTPYTTEDLSATVGSYTVNSKFLKMADPLVTHETFNHSIAYADGNIYLMEKKKIRKFTVGETGLELAAEYDLENDYKTMVSTEDGRIFLSGYAKPLVEWKDGEIVKEYSGKASSIYMAPNGSFGIADYSKGEKVGKVTLSGDGFEITPMPLNEVGSIAYLNVSNEHIFACGNSSDENVKGHKVFVYDTDGNFQVMLEGVDEDHGLGCVTYVFDTANGYMGMDGNMRKIMFWDKSGTCIGTLEDSDLFGTHYPWFSDSILTPDGNLFTVMTEERSDKSAKEVLVFMMNGF